MTSSEPQRVLTSDSLRGRPDDRLLQRCQDCYVLETLLCDPPARLLVVSVCQCLTHTRLPSRCKAEAEGLKLSSQSAHWPLTGWHTAAP